MAHDSWEWLEGLRPESTIATTVKHLAKMIAGDLERWPPAVSPAEGRGASRFAEVLDPEARRPSAAAFTEATRRAAWELSRDYDALGFYDRNQRLAEACPSAFDQVASEFIEHYILEAFLTLIEKTENRVKRKDVLAGVVLLGRRFAAAAAT